MSGSRIRLARRRAPQQRTRCLPSSRRWSDARGDLLGETLCRESALMHHELISAFNLCESPAIAQTRESNPSLNLDNEYLPLSAGVRLKTDTTVNQLHVSWWTAV